MTKKKLIELVGRRAEIKKSLKAKRRELGRLGNEVLALEADYAAIEGVELHEGVPVRVAESADADNGYEVFAVFSARTAFVDCEDEGFVAYAVIDDATEDALCEAGTLKAALKAAKDYAAGVKPGKPARRSPKAA